MDLVTFIPGIGATAPFTPGPTTPAPFNINHTGLTDGTTPETSSVNKAEVYNRLLLNQDAAISAAGLPVDHNNWAQLSVAMRKIAQDAALAAAGGVTVGVGIARAAATIHIDGTTFMPSLTDSYNVASVSKNGVDFVIVFTNPMSSVYWYSAYTMMILDRSFYNVLFTEMSKSESMVNVRLARDEGDIIDARGLDFTFIAFQ